MRRDDRHELQKQEAFALGGAPCKSLVKCTTSHLPRDWRGNRANTAITARPERDGFPLGQLSIAVDVIPLRGLIPLNVGYAEECARYCR